MAGHRRPMNVGGHWFVKSNGVACELQKPAKRIDLVKVVDIVRSAHFDPVLLHQQRHHIAAIAFSIALDAAILSKNDDNMRV